MGEAKRRKMNEMTQDAFNKLIESTETINLHQFETNPFKQKDSMGLLAVVIPGGLQKIDTKPTGVLYYATKESEKPEYWANTDYGICYAHWKLVGATDEREEKVLAIELNDGGEFGVYCTEIPEKKFTIQSVFSVFLSVIKGCPEDVKMRIVEQLRKQYQNTGRWSIRLLPSHENIGILTKP